MTDFALLETQGLPETMERVSKPTVCTKMQPVAEYEIKTAMTPARARQTSPGVLHTADRKLFHVLNAVGLYVRNSVVILLRT